MHLQVHLTLLNLLTNRPQKITLAASEKWPDELIKTINNFFFVAVFEEVNSEFNFGKLRLKRILHFVDS